MTRPCKYECGVMLDAWDEQAHKYREAETNEIHTVERCQAAKLLKLAEKSKQEQREREKNSEADQVNDGINREEKNDHGNELVIDSGRDITKPYVDHTLAKPSEVKIFFSDLPADVEKEYKAFQVGKKFVWTRAQYELERDEDNKILFTICMFYELAP